MMASAGQYDSQGEEDDYDEADNSQRMNISSRAYNYPENYNYFHSSPRDLTLNLPKTTTNSFKSYQPIYDSPESEDVSLSRYLSVSVSLGEILYIFSPISAYFHYTYIFPFSVPYH